METFKSQLKIDKDFGTIISQKVDKQIGTEEGVCNFVHPLL